MSAAGKEIDDLFVALRHLARVSCTCDARDIVAPLFHRDACPYKPISSLALDSFGVDGSAATEKVQAKINEVAPGHIRPVESGGTK